jgi:hypothetical protein
VRSAGAYYLLTPAESTRPAEVELFANWLSAQV